MRRWIALVLLAGCSHVRPPERSSDESRVRGLVDALGDPDVEIRTAALRRLSEMGVAAARVVRANVLHSDPEIAASCLWLADRLLNDWEWYRGSYLHGVDLQEAEWMERPDDSDAAAGIGWVEALRRHTVGCADFMTTCPAPCPRHRENLVAFLVDADVAGPLAAALVTLHPPNDRPLLDFFRDLASASDTDFVIATTGTLFFMPRRRVYENYWDDARRARFRP